MMVAPCGLPVGQGRSQENRCRHDGKGKPRLARGAKKPVEVHPTCTPFLVQGDSMPDFRFEAGRQIGLRLPLAQEGLQSLIVFGIHDGLEIMELRLKSERSRHPPGMEPGRCTTSASVSRQTAVPGAGCRVHRTTADQGAARLAGLRHSGAVQLGTALGTEGGAIEDPAGRGRRRNVLAGFAVVNRRIRQSRPRKEQPDSDNRGENYCFHGITLSFVRRWLCRPYRNKHRLCANPLKCHARDKMGGVIPLGSAYVKAWGRLKLPETGGLQLSGQGITRTRQRLSSAQPRACGVPGRAAGKKSGWGQRRHRHQPHPLGNY